MDDVLLKKKSLIVVVLTLMTMTAEIYFGIVTNSMALIADGAHIGMYASTVFVGYIVYLFSLKYKKKSKRINAFGYNINAILLGLAGAALISESIERFVYPMPVYFSEAVLAALAGMITNFVCVFIMMDKSEKQTLKSLRCKSIFARIIPDIFTSVSAVFALLAGMYLGWKILDPICGVLGGVIITKGALNLLHSSCKALTPESCSNKN